MVIESFYPVFEILKKQSDWKLVFEDKFFAVFVKSSYKQKKYVSPSMDMNYYKRTIFDTNIKFSRK